MVTIVDICSQTNLSSDDVRLILSDIREDWEYTETVTPSEADLIKQSARAALSDSSTEITPVADMPLEKQNALINNASQVLGQQLIFGVQQRVEMADAVDKLTNQIILNNRLINQQDLAAQMAMQDESVKAEFMQAINTLQKLVNAPVEAPNNSDKTDFDEAVNKVQQSIALMQKKPIR